MNDSIELDDNISLDNVDLKSEDDIELMSQTRTLIQPPKKIKRHRIFIPRPKKIRTLSDEKRKCFYLSFGSWIVMFIILLIVSVMYHIDVHGSIATEGIITDIDRFLDECSHQVCLVNNECQNEKYVCWHVRIKYKYKVGDEIYKGEYQNLFDNVKFSSIQSQEYYDHYSKNNKIIVYYNPNHPHSYHGLNKEDAISHGLIIIIVMLAIGLSLILPSIYFQFKEIKLEI